MDKKSLKNEIKRLQEIIQRGDWENTRLNAKLENIQRHLEWMRQERDEMVKLIKTVSACRHNRRWGGLKDLKTDEH